MQATRSLLDIVPQRSIKDRNGLIGAYGAHLTFRNDEHAAKIVSVRFKSSVAKCSISSAIKNTCCATQQFFG